LESLADPYVRSRIRQKIAEVGFNNFGQIDSWADVRIAISPRGAAEPGRTIEEITRERRCDPLDAVRDVIIADKGATRILVRSMSEADVRAIAADPSALVGSDGPRVASYGITCRGKPICASTAQELAHAAQCLECAARRTGRHKPLAQPRTA
jgi:N-acyl-D-aspartate/D-glutamate deacylase